MIVNIYWFLSTVWMPLFHQELEFFCFAGHWLLEKEPLMVY